jgi:hypothetical protein
MNPERAQIMRDFFRGWKRKIGVVTLLIAALFMALWVRSYSVEDEFFYLDEDAKLDNFLHITPRGFSWMRREDRYAFTGLGWNRYPSQVPETSDPYEEEVFTDRTLISRRQWNGFYFSERVDDGEMGDQSREWLRIIPHWSITIPLTLISAWLLLLKPKPAKDRQSTIETAS